MPPPAPVSYVDAIRELKRSVAPIVCAQYNQGTGAWSVETVEGSAFFVDNQGAFATAAHVVTAIVTARQQQRCPNPTVYLPRDGWGINASFVVTYNVFAPEKCVMNPQLDIAVCRPTVQVAEARPVAFEEAVQPDGTNVVFTGFPLNRVAPISARGMIAGYADITDAGPVTIILDGTNWPGASGSPIYLNNGKVIGMITRRGTGEASGLAYGNTAHFITGVVAEAKRLNVQ